MRTKSALFLQAMVLASLWPTVASSSETVSYEYDAKGRLVRVVRSGTVNNNVTVEYEHDKADNRTRAKTTNSPNPP